MAVSRNDSLYGFIAGPTRVGCGHSYTEQETLAMSKVQKYILLAQIRKERLTDYTTPNWYYCIVEDGSIFKYNPGDNSFYGLDLERFVWVWDRRFVSIFYDTFLKFQEISGFRDYFPHDAPTEMDNRQPIFDGIHNFVHRNEHMPGQSYYECTRCGFKVSDHALDMLRFDIGDAPTVTIWPCRSKRYAYCTCGKLAGNGANGTCIYSENVAICSTCGQFFIGHHNCEDDRLTKKFLSDLGLSD